jgi:hypothetical protein
LRDSITTNFPRKELQEICWWEESRCVDEEQTEKRLKIVWVVMVLWRRGRTDKKEVKEKDKMTEKAVEENTTLVQKVTEGGEYFAVAHIFASFNDTFVVSHFKLFSSSRFHLFPLPSSNL